MPRMPITAEPALVGRHGARRPGARLLERPASRQARSEVGVLRIAGVLLLEGLEQFDQLPLIQAQHVGDHTRGLFEAEASVAASALHPVHDVAIACVHHTSAKPTRCALMASTTGRGVPSSAMCTRTRKRMRHVSLSFTATNMTNAFSTSSPGAASMRTV